MTDREIMLSFVDFANCGTQIIFCGLIISFSLVVICSHFRPRGKVGEYGKKYVFITGCDSGFGKETAIRLDQLGFHVFATCLTTEGEESLSEVCSDKVKTLHLDVTNSHKVRDAFEFVRNSIPSSGGLWGIVNNAGIASSGPIEWEPLSSFRRVADVNLWGMIDVTKVFLPLIKQSKGRIVNISSFSGCFSAPYLAAYNISKYGVEAFSDALRRELSPWQVAVSIIEPGTYATPMSAPALGISKLENLWNGLSEEMKTEQRNIYEECKNFITKEFAKMRSPKTYQVVEDIVDALTSESPHTRYRCGIPCKVILALLPWIPTSVVDKIVSWWLTFLQTSGAS